MEGRNMISMFVADKMKIKEFTRKIDQERKRQEALTKLEGQSDVNRKNSPERTIKGLFTRANLSIYSKFIRNRRTLCRK